MEWLAVAEARRTWQRFRNDFLAVPRRCRARFAWTLTVAWSVLCAATLAAALLLRGERGERLEQWEAGLLPSLIDALPIGYSMAVFFESPGNGVITLPLTVACAVFHARRHRPLEAVAVLASSLLAAVVVGIGWAAWPRDRPGFIYPDVPDGTLRAFPSGHMGTAIPLYGVLGWLWLRGTTSRAERAAGAALVLLLITTVAASRIVLSAHWPSDVAAGAAIGASWLAVIVAALRASARCR
jgi:membrane-associated phospholipid phosphatase